MYSQHDEEKVILEVLGAGEPGVLYDIGAWEGLQFSNSRALLEKGWSGVMVEPSPSAFVGLMKNTEVFGDRVKLVNVALAENAMVRKFYDAGGDAVGTLSEAHRALWDKVPMRPIYVNTLQVVDLFSVFGPGQYINLDVEGLNWELFQLLPLSWPDFRLICVEHEGKIEQMHRHAGNFGFRKLHQTVENLILVRDA